MKRGGFRLPMKKYEAVIGWVYVFLHTFVMGYAVVIANELLFPRLGFQLTSPQVNMFYYAFGFVFLMLTMFFYLRETFRDFCGNFWRSLTSAGLGYLLYILSNYAVSFLLLLFLDDLVNPNSAAIDAEAKLNPNVMLVTSVILAPIVEEILFRGVVFGTVRKRSRATAYIVTALFFAFYHLWEYFLYGWDWEIVLYLFQYIPAGLILAWVYERSGNLWAPILMHALVNYVSISVTLG